MAQKLDYLISYGTRSEPVKARIFQGVDGQTYASIHGDLFNDCEISSHRLDQLIHLLQDVRRAVAAGHSLAEDDL